MQLNLQLFTGGGDLPADLDMAAVLDRLERVLHTGRLERLIVGWNPAVNLSEIRSLLQGSGVKLFLWMPCFSELEAYGAFPPLIGADGKPINIRFERGNGERFQFACPATSVARIIDVYEKHYANGKYDGIFLDKIRYPSFLGGVSSVLGCYCDHCRAQYPLPDIREFAALDLPNPFGISAYTGLRYRMDDAYQRLFDGKCNAVFDAISELVHYFRGRGLFIGFDLFAPFLAYFVGQDIRRLLELADFVKPMFYAVTDAPAGLPFEIGEYARAFGSDAGNAALRRNALLEIVGGEAGLMGRELRDMKRFILDQQLAVKVCAGIEFNRIAGVAAVDSAYLQGSLREARDADGIVASWDLNTIQDEQLDCLLRYS